MSHCLRYPLVRLLGMTLIILGCGSVPALAICPQTVTRPTNSSIKVGAVSQLLLAEAVSGFRLLGAEEPAVEEPEQDRSPMSIQWIDPWAAQPRWVSSASQSLGSTKREPEGPLDADLLGVGSGLGLKSAFAQLLRQRSRAEVDSRRTQSLVAELNSRSVCTRQALRWADRSFVATFTSHVSYSSLLQRWAC